MLKIFRKKLISKKSKKGISFIAKLFKKGTISYPIDYEVCQPTEEELKVTLNCWFGNSKWSENGDRFIQFGMDGTGSMYCLWFYPNLSAEPPVVLFGSEGERFLVASNVDDFIRQLSSGKLFCGGHWLEPNDEEKVELDWSYLKTKAVEYLGEWVDTPETIRDKAELAHPSFSAWVEDKSS